MSFHSRRTFRRLWFASNLFEPVAPAGIVINTDYNRSFLSRVKHDLFITKHRLHINLKILCIHLSIVPL